MAAAAAVSNGDCAAASGPTVLYGRRSGWRRVVRPSCCLACLNARPSSSSPPLADAMFAYKVSLAPATAGSLAMQRANTTLLVAVCGRHHPLAAVGRSAADSQRLKPRAHCCYMSCTDESTDWSMRGRPQPSPLPTPTCSRRRAAHGLLLALATSIGRCSSSSPPPPSLSLPSPSAAGRSCGQQPEASRPAARSCGGRACGAAGAGAVKLGAACSAAALR
jgi:hypothetical protein